MENIEGKKSVLEGKHRFLKDEQAADLIGLSVQTLRNWRFKREGPPYIRAGRSIRYSFQDLLGWMEGKRIDPTN